MEAMRAARLQRLTTRLKLPNPTARQRAAKTLGAMGDPHAVEPLIAALADENAGVQSNAAEALKNITGKDFSKDSAKWSAWWKENKKTVLQGE